jgi:pimeloyl-ACP methyl ester carboxylesterase
MRKRSTAQHFRPLRLAGTGSAVPWVVGILLVVALVVLGGFWWVRENPLALYEKTTRRALADSGFELESFASSVGSIAYWVAGDGPPLVFLHGVGDQAGAFHAIAPAFVDEYRVIVPDLAGHGGSDPGAGPLPMTVVYRGLEELLESLAPDVPVTLVGSSMGGWLAMVQAHRHPDLVARVVAINGGALRGDPTDLTLLPADREAARTLMRALRDPESEPVPDFVLDDIVERAAEGPIGRMMAEPASFEEFLLDGELEEITVPVDLLWGASDQLMTVEYAERMAAQLPRARVTLIDACGHHPANECPGKLQAGLREVLAMAPPGPRERSIEPAEVIGEPGVERNAASAQGNPESD